MNRAVQRRSMRLARRGPDAFRTEEGRHELARHLMTAGAAKPGWKSRNWIMSQEWFDICLTIRFRSEEPGFLYGLGICVDENAGFPRIERYVRKD